MTSLTTNIALFSLTLLTSSCDCLQHVTGTILDQDSMQPLDSVYVHKYSYDNGEYTDAKGNFKLNAISGGLCGCPSMQILATKNGYEMTTEKINNTRSKIIYMKRKKK